MRARAEAGQLAQARAQIERVFSPAASTEERARWLERIRTNPVWRTTRDLPGIAELLARLETDLSETPDTP